MGDIAKGIYPNNTRAVHFFFTHPVAFANFGKEKRILIRTQNRRILLPVLLFQKPFNFKKFRKYKQIKQAFRTKKNCLGFYSLILVNFLIQKKHTRNKMDKELFEKGLGKTQSYFRRKYISFNKYHSKNTKIRTDRILLFHPMNFK